MSSSVLHDQIPHSILFPNQPLFYLPPNVFGCICFVHILTPGDKLLAKATKCVFLSYSRLQRGYRYYSPDTHRYFIFVDVTYFENSSMFPNSSPMAPSSLMSVLPSPANLPIAVWKGTCSSRNPHPIYNFLTYHRLSSSYSAFISTLSSVFPPKTTHEALSFGLETGNS